MYIAEIGSIEPKMGGARWVGVYSWGIDKGYPSYFLGKLTIWIIQMTIRAKLFT